MKKIEELSIITQQVYDRLIRSEQGETISYDDIRTLIGMDPQADGYHYVKSARDKALREDGIVSDAKPNIGIYLLTDEEIALSRGNKAASRIRKISFKTRREIASVKDFGALSNAAKVAHNTGLSIVGVFLHFTKPKSIRRLSAEIAEKQQVLDFKPTIKLFDK